MISFIKLYLIISFLLVFISGTNVYANINNFYKIQHFWKSTGFCPPRENISKFLLSEDQKINIALIGALPNKSIKEIRVHWILDLITAKINSHHEPVYNFTNLDLFLDWMHLQRLRPIFELMGNPSSYFDNFNTTDKAKNWYLLVKQIVLRYISRYGVTYVSKWKFETWNEPDLKGYNILPFSFEGYKYYLMANYAALSEIRYATNHENGFRLGGPAGLFKDPTKHRLCWGVLKICNSNNPCPFNFLTFHKKGDETAAGVIEKGLELVENIHMNYKNLKSLPIANTEADIMTNWSKDREWRGDVRYAAMVIKVIVGYFKEFIKNRNISIEVLSNDNGFLNYYPYFFSQRTLVTRFQMNNTKPPHVQFFKKPVYVAMGLLSFLSENISISTNKFFNNYPEIIGLNSYTHFDDHFESCSIYIAVNDTHIDNETYVLHFTEFGPKLTSKYVIYMLDNSLTNPYDVWRKAGKPVFPAKNLRYKMRKVEGPHRLVPPTEIQNGTFTVTVNVSVPSVTMVHVCSKSKKTPGAVTNLQIFNVTRNEILFIWSDEFVATKCIRTYEVEFLADLIENEIADLLFRRVNSDDVIFLSYQHVVTGSPTSDEGTVGTYRVRAVDYWDRPGPYSPPVRFPLVK